ncbi:MAG: polyprenyl synthetase family protein [Gammaproteobacteria bacterium]|jgi:geranylgeranyl pyrophosphate synthase
MLESFLSDIRSQVITDTEDLIKPNSSVAKAMLYTATAESKCFRAALVHATAAGLAFNNITAIRELAVCIEMLHSYSLIHDDLPCMDDDDLRRGKPANHIEFGESTAVLAGDALQLRALQVIVDSASIDADAKIQILHNLLTSCGYQGMILGQELDMLAEQDSTVDIRKIHSLKTGKLIQSAITCAARLQDSNTNIDDFEQMGWHIGMAFQITDDILEFTQTSESLGKSNLSDAKNQKLTYVSKFGIEESKSEAQQHIQTSLEIAKRCLEQPNRMMDLAKMVLGRTS